MEEMIKAVRELAANMQQDGGDKVLLSATHDLIIACTELITATDSENIEVASSAT